MKTFSRLSDISDDGDTMLNQYFLHFWLLFLASTVVCGFLIEKLSPGNSICWTDLHPSIINPGLICHIIFYHSIWHSYPCHSSWSAVETKYLHFEQILFFFLFFFWGEPCTTIWTPSREKMSENIAILDRGASSSYMFGQHVVHHLSWSLLSALLHKGQIMPHPCTRSWHQM